MSALACLSCGRLGPVELHHLTGRYGPRLAYLDPCLVVALCKACHDREHVTLRRIGLEFVGNRDPLAHRVQRVAGSCISLAEADRGLVLDVSSNKALGLLLVEAGAAFDRKCAGVK